MHDVFPIQTNRTAPFHTIIIVNRELCIGMCITSNRSFHHIHVTIFRKHTDDAIFGSILFVPCKSFASCFQKLLMFSSCFNLIFFIVDKELGSPFLQEMLAFPDILVIPVKLLQRTKQHSQDASIFLTIAPKIQSKCFVRSGECYKQHFSEQKQMFIYLHLT